MDTINMKAANADAIVSYLHQWFLMTFPTGDPNPQRFYCGITNDIDARMSAHKTQDCNGKDIEHKIAIECSSESVAEDVEDRMGKMNFDIGNPKYKGNGAAPDSNIVYLYKKP